MRKRNLCIWLLNRYGENQDFNRGYLILKFAVSVAPLTFSELPFYIAKPFMVSR